MKVRKITLITMILAILSMLIYTTTILPFIMGLLATLLNIEELFTLKDNEKTRIFMIIIWGISTLLWFTIYLGAN